MARTELKLVEGKLEVNSVIERLIEMRPELEELPEFDESRKSDFVYCIEWGAHKQLNMERAVYDRTLAELHEMLGYGKIKIVLPIGYMNCGVSVDNVFISDTNNSAAFDVMSVPLPKPNYQWSIYKYERDADRPEKQTVVLVDMP
jgi:hypothetical protein